LDRLEVTLPEVFFDWEVLREGGGLRGTDWRTRALAFNRPVFDRIGELLSASSIHVGA
jgi:hypothetical protein